MIVSNLGKWIVFPSEIVKFLKKNKETKNASHRDPKREVSRRMSLIFPVFLLLYDQSLT